MNKCSKLKLLTRQSLINWTLIKNNSTLSEFVPKHDPLKKDDLDKINEFVINVNRLFVLTGAGISTESGIPDYRSEKVGLYAKSDRRPLDIKDFMSSSSKRRMYWARNYVSWPRFSGLRPNLNHATFALWEKKGKVHHHVTQNVDSLLLKSGCLNLTELHGSSFSVKCVECSFEMTRESMQLLIKECNQNWFATSNELNPDNDVFLNDDDILSFILPKCPKCKTDKLKPDVVFFGDSIPSSRTQLVNHKLNQCDGLLAAGSSLEVFSAYRLILKAKDLKIPVAILNIGKTRADKLADLRVNSKCSDVLSKIVF